MQCVPECRMNNTWSSSASVCVQPQSEQLTHPTNNQQQQQQSYASASSNGENRPSSSSLSLSLSSSRQNLPVFARPLQAVTHYYTTTTTTSTTANNYSQRQFSIRPSFITNGIPNSFVKKGEERFIDDLKCSIVATTTSLPDKTIVSSSQPSTSKIKSSIKKDLNLSLSSSPNREDNQQQDSQQQSHSLLSSLSSLPPSSSSSSSSINRRRRRHRCNFVLSLKESHQLARIAELQPHLIRYLGIISVKVGDANEIKVASNEKTLRLSTGKQQSTIPLINNINNNLPKIEISRENFSSAAVTNQSSNSEAMLRHEVTPSTSNCERQKISENTQMENTTVSPRDTSDMGICNQSFVKNNGGRNQNNKEIASQSPLLVNLLRCASPSGNNNSVINAPRSVGYPFANHSSLSNSQPQHSINYQPYTYASMPMSVPPSTSTSNPAQLPTSTEVTNQSLQSSMAEQQFQQQQQQAMHQQQVNAEMHRQILASQQHQSSQMNQANYYPPPQYAQQHQPTPPQTTNYIIRGPISQQSNTVYHQQGPPVRPQYMQIQQSPQMRPPVHSVHAHYHQVVPIDQQEMVTSVQTGPPPSKKRKRPTKKQIREAQQAAAAAAAAQQRQYMMEQQMTVRVPSANNAHTVERPGIMPQMASGSGNSGVSYSQHQRMHPPPVMQNTSPGSHMQSPSSSATYYSQQHQPQSSQQQPHQHIWSTHQPQQQLLQAQRPAQINQTQQVIYSGQMQQQWQTNQTHTARIIYPQIDNGSEMNSPSTASVHTSPMPSRNSVDYSPASQGSNTMSPLYQQQQILYQSHQQQISQPSTPSYNQIPSSQGIVINQGRRNEGHHQMQSNVRMTMQQQQQPTYIIDQQLIHQTQIKNATAVMETNTDFVMQEELGANIADDCGDFNDLDSIEPMKESGDVGAVLIASHQQQQQSHMILARHEQEFGDQPTHAYRQSQNEYEVVMQQSRNLSSDFARQMHHVSAEYMPSSNVHSVANYQIHPQQRHNVNICYQLQQQSSTSQGCFVQQQHIPPNPQNAVGPTNPQIAYSSTNAHHLPQACSVNTSSIYAQTYNTSRSADEISHSDDSNVNLSSSNSGVDGEKDRINSSIESVVMKALSDQDGQTSLLNSNRVAQRSRLFHSQQAPTTSSISTSLADHQRLATGKYTATGNGNGVKGFNVVRQPSHPTSLSFASSQQFTNSNDSLSMSNINLMSHSNGSPSLITRPSPLVHQLTTGTSMGVHSESLGGALDQNEFRSKINQSEMKNSDRSESVDSLKSITQQNYAIANGHEPHLMKDHL